jgi:hypothetical protein
MSTRTDVKAMEYTADMLTYNTKKPTNAEPSTKPERGKGRMNAQIATPTIGPILRERREAMGVTLAEAEVATRIRQKYGIYCRARWWGAVFCAITRLTWASSRPR